jgi:hypothetical protein
MLSLNISDHISLCFYEYMVSFKQYVPQSVLGFIFRVYRVRIGLKEQNSSVLICNIVYAQKPIKGPAGTYNSYMQLYVTMVAVKKFNSYSATKDMSGLETLILTEMLLSFALSVKRNILCHFMSIQTNYFQPFTYEKYGLP